MLWPLHQTIMMNSTTIFPWMWRMWRMPSCGGMKGVLLFLAFLIWLGIISQSQVSVSSSLLFLLIFCPLATTVDIEWVFSHGHLVLLHVCNHLVIQSTHASLCVGVWSSLGLVKDSDIKMSVGKDDIIGKKEDLPKNWDAITPVELLK
jgi:hypothetical protein